MNGLVIARLYSGGLLVARIHMRLSEGEMQNVQKWPRISVMDRSAKGATDSAMELARASTPTDAFETQVARKPQAVALEGDGVRLTYAELDSRANRLAATIAERHGTSNTPMPLLCGHRAEAILGILAVLKAGKCFVPLNPANPAEYLKRIWTHSGASAILAGSPELPLARQICGTVDGCIPLDIRAPFESAAPPLLDRDPERLAAIVYTSGSTGEPKGVMTTHRSILVRVQHQALVASYVSGDRQGSIVHWGHSASFPDVFGALLHGIRLLPFDIAAEGMMRLISWLHEENITLLQMPAAAVAGFLDVAVAGEIRLPHIRLVSLSGSRLCRAEALALWRVFPRACLLHGYGSSEANLVAQQIMHPCLVPDGDPLPVGYVVAGKQVKVVNDLGQPVPDGVTGELVVVSDHLSPGYWGDPSATKTSFYEEVNGRQRCFHTGDLGWCRPDGLLVLAGRKDFVVKIRGNRVDLAEVEMRLRSSGWAREATVIVHHRRSGEAILIAYVVPGQKVNLAPKDLREELERTLPPYMVPGRLILMEALPLSASGKVDRSVLPPPDKARPTIHVAFRSPENEMQKLVCRIWAELLEVSEVGMDDDFFDLGGDSLSAMRMLAQVEQELGANVPMAFFETPTVSALLATIRSDPGSGPRLRPTECRPGTNAFVRPERQWRHMFRGAWDWVRAFLGKPGRNAKLAEIAAPTAAMLMPYTVGCRWLAWWCSHADIVERIYCRQYSLFGRFLSDFGCHASDPEAAFRSSLLGNLAMLSMFHRLHIPAEYSGRLLDALKASPLPFRRSAGNLIERAGIDELRKWFHYSGLQFLEEMLALKRGVILLSYHGTGQLLASRALRRFLDNRPIQFLSRHASRKRGQRRIEKGGSSSTIAAIEVVRDTLAARRSLESGGLVQIVLENSPSPSAIACSIGGRLYHLESGFADLSISTGAAIIPWDAHYGERGCIRAQFRRPLTNDNTDAGREAQAAALVRRYAGLLESIWQEAPSSLDWRLIKMHYSLPEAVDAQPTQGPSSDTDGDNL